MADHFLQTDHPTVITAGANTLALTRSATGTGFAAWFETQAATGFVELEPKWYECDRTIVLPNQTAIKVNGNGAKIKDAAFSRSTVETTDDDDPSSTRITMKDLTCIGSSGFCLEDRATYSSVIQDCRFEGYDTALQFSFGLQTLVQRCQFYNNTTSVMLTYGEIFGGSSGGTCSNGSVVRDCYAYTNDASANVFRCEHADNCMFENILSEGPAVNTHIYQRSPSNGTTKRFNARNIRCNSPTVTTACIYSSFFGGTMRFEGVTSPYAVTLYDHSGSTGNPHMEMSFCMPLDTMLTASPLVGPDPYNASFNWDIGRTGADWDAGWYSADRFADELADKGLTLRAINSSSGVVELEGSDINAGM